jgi:hypothetical protein
VSFPSIEPGCPYDKSFRIIFKSQYFPLGLGSSVSINRIDQIILPVRPCVFSGENIIGGYMYEESIT